MLDLEVILNKLFSIIDRKKQNKLTAGENITIVNDVISATSGGGGGSYTAGNGVSINNKVISTKVDNSTIKFDENGVMYAESGESGVEYHAGVGLELDNITHTFSVDDSIATMEQVENEAAIRQQAYNQLDELKQDMLIAGENIQINDSVISATDTTYSDATKNTHGLMSASDKSKLDGISVGAEVNVQSDWNATSGDAFIKNKPSIPNTANNGKLTIMQNGVEVGQFTADASQDETISLTDTNTEYDAGEGLAKENNEFTVIGFSTQKLLATTDFNNVTTNGVYSCPSLSSSIDYNRPTTANGILEVRNYSSSSGELVLCVQTFHRASSVYNESYIRRKYTNGEWGQWDSFISQLGDGLSSDVNNNKAKIDYSVVQSKLESGDNIEIKNGVISAKDTTYTVATSGGLKITNNQFSVDTDVIATKESVNAKQDKLTQTGNSKKGVYINSNGVPTVMTYSLESNVPANAIFTDTTYTNGNGLKLTGNSFSIDYSDQIKEYNRLYTTGKNIIGKLGDTNIYGNAPTQHFNSNSTSSYVYIDANGNDTTGDGTSSKPFKTLQTALEKTLNNGWTDCRILFQNFITDTEMVLTKKNIHEATLHMMNQSNALITIKFSSSGASGKPAFYNVHFNFDGKFDGGTGGFKIECATSDDYTYIEGGTFVYKDVHFSNKVVSFGSAKGIYQNCVFDGGVDISSGSVRLIDCVYNQPEIIGQSSGQAKYMVYIRDGANVNVMGSQVCNSSRTTTASNTSCAYYITEAQAIFSDDCVFVFNKAISSAVNFYYCLGLRNGQVHIPEAILSSLKNSFGSNIYKRTQGTSLINTGLSELPSGGGGRTYNAGEGLSLIDDTFAVDYTTTQKALNASDGLSIADDTISLASKSYTSTNFPWRETINGKSVASFDKAYQEGTYALSLYGAGDQTSVSNTIGFPLTSNSLIYGELIVSRAYSTSRYVQIYIYAASSTTSYKTRIFFRNSYNNTDSWKSWREVASLADIADLDISSLSLEVSATDYPWWVEP